MQYALEEVEGWARAAKEGERRAVEALLAATEHVIAAAVRQVADASDDAREDMAQAARCAVWAAIATYDPARCRWYGYAQTIIRRTVFREAKRARERRRREKQAAAELRRASRDLRTASPAELVAAAQAAKERLRAERRAAARRLERAKRGTKQEEIAVRLELGATLQPGEPLRWLAVGEVDALRLALLTHLLHEQRPRARRRLLDMARAAGPGARDFFSRPQVGQVPGAPKKGARGLFSAPREKR